MMQNGLLARYAKLRATHAPGMPGMFSPLPGVSDPDMHRGTCATHVPWCMSGSVTSGFLWSRWRGKRSRHSQRMCNPRFYVSGKRPVMQPLMTHTTEAKHELGSCELTNECICNTHLVFIAQLTPLLSVMRISDSRTSLVTLILVQRWWKLRSGPRLNIKTIFSRYGDSHVKDKTVARPSYL